MPAHHQNSMPRTPSWSPWRAGRAAERPHAEGAAVRDDDGRTYAAATVTLPSLQLTALQAAVAIAVSSGARSLEAAAVVGAAAELDPASAAVAHDVATGILILASADGTVRSRTQV